MNCKKKGLLSLALVVSLSLSFSGCNEGETPNAKKPVKVSKFTQITQSTDLVNELDGAQLTLSKDENWVYFTTTTRTKFYAVEVGGEANFAKNVVDGDKWHNIVLNANALATANAALDDSAAGKAALVSANAVTYISPASDGALVSVSAATNTDNGVIYFKGAAPTLAWGSDNAHLDHITAGNRVTGYIVKKDAVDVPYVFDVSTYVGTTKASLTPAAIIDLAVNRANVFGAVPKLAYDANHAFAVDTTGVAVMAKNLIGTNNNFAAVDPAAASSTWEQSNTVPNRSVNAIFVANGKLYIGLNGNVANEGGVAVYNIATPATKKPEPTSWSQVSVLGFVEFDGKVLAVTEGGLYEVDDSGANVEKGDLEITPAKVADAANKAVKDYDSLKDGYDGVMPAGITGAQAVGDHLIMTTAANGVHVMILTTEEISKPNSK